MSELKSQLPSFDENRTLLPFVPVVERALKTIGEKLNDHTPTERRRLCQIVKSVTDDLHQQQQTAEE